MISSFTANIISTHTSRVGCDGYRAEVWSWKYHFYSHIPCGMWLSFPTWTAVQERISTHTSRVGCDVATERQMYTNLKFLLTHPVWDVTRTILGIFRPIRNFYSHIPCGMWHSRVTTNVFIISFLLTHPVWDVTPIRPMISAIFKFLLTHPVWDVTTRQPQGIRRRRFLLTHPVWDVTDPQTKSTTAAKNFYSHIPCGMWLILPKLLI